MCNVAVPAWYPQFDALSLDISSAVKKQIIHTDHQHVYGQYNSTRKLHNIFNSKFAVKLLYHNLQGNKINDYNQKSGQILPIRRHHKSSMLHALDGF